MQARPPTLAELKKLAEREGFEPPVPCGTPDFESGALDHSATSPVHPHRAGAQMGKRRKRRTHSRKRKEILANMSGRGAPRAVTIQLDCFVACGVGAPQ